MSGEWTPKFKREQLSQETIVYTGLVSKLPNLGYFPNYPDDVLEEGVNITGLEFVEGVVCGKITTWVLISFGFSFSMLRPDSVSASNR